jgi:hypothetical protein
MVQYIVEGQGQVKGALTKPIKTCVFSAKELFKNNKSYTDFPIGFYYYYRDLTIPKMPVIKQFFLA